MLPDSQSLRESPRRSIAMFADPDSDVEVVCFDGTNKYPPVNAGEYIKQLLREAYP